MGDFISFVWDEEKNKANFIKHGILFQEAQDIFDDDYMIYNYDFTHSNYEQRFQAIGMSAQKRILMVVHCVSDGLIVRIISARKVDKKEKQDYEERRARLERN